MTESKRKAGIAEIKKTLGGDEDFLREGLRVICRRFWRVR